MAPGGGLQQVQPARGAGHAVAPNQTVTYTWHVPPGSGPGPGDFSAVAYTYRSTVDITAHENAGLFGAIVVERPVGPLCRPLTARRTRQSLTDSPLPSLLAMIHVLQCGLDKTSMAGTCTAPDVCPAFCRGEERFEVQRCPYHVTQDGDADAYVEVPLMFSIQNEGLSALRPANLAARAAQGLALNTTADDFIVRALP